MSLLIPVISSLWQKSRQAECLRHRLRKQLIPDGGAGGFACVPGLWRLLPQAVNLGLPVPPKAAKAAGAAGT
jgi:hypothetical protein